MRDAAILLTVQVARPAGFGSEDATDPHDGAWTTGFFKRPVEGSVFAGVTNLEGDGQADLENHGGIDKAVLAYSADHYPAWRRELAIPDLSHGAFGENLTIAGLGEDSVHVGDVFEIGTARFEVSQPRQPCWKLARRWRMHELPGLVVRSGRSGWYFRVLEPGRVQRQTTVTLIASPNPEWSIARANRIFHHHKSDLALTRQLADVPGLSDSWREALRARAERLLASGTAGRS
jgi:MOSC domain-containing protein YiiM